MRIAVLGATGQLGRDVVRAARAAGHEPVPFGHGGDADARDAEDGSGAAGARSLDVTEEDATREALAAVRPDAVVNCAAFTDVDGSEARPAAAFSANATGALHVARAARSAGARLAHVSTDYVFSGEKGEPYHEEDVPGRPVNVYGASKLAGEHLVRQAAPAALIVRVAALFGPGGRATGRGNFVETVLGRAEAGAELWGVEDVRVSPTHAPDAARALLSLLEAGAGGVFHCTNRGSVTWHGFAGKALELAGYEGVEVRRVRQSETDRPARRPPDSSLVSRREGPHREAMARSWAEALAEYVEGRVAPERSGPYTIG